VAAFLSVLTTYVLTIPSPVDYKELYDCSDFFLAFNVSDSRAITQDYVTNQRARAVLIALWVIRTVVFLLSQEYMAYYKVFCEDEEPVPLAVFFV
jgi:hypothetical protein